jgi:hypothetical protein
MIGSGRPINQPNSAYLIFPLRCLNCFNMMDSHVIKGCLVSQITMWPRTLNSKRWAKLDLGRS